MTKQRNRENKETLSIVPAQELWVDPSLEAFSFVNFTYLEKC